MVFPSRGLRPRLRLIRPRREPSSRSSPGHIDVGGSFPAPGREHLVQRQDTLAHHAQSVLRDLEEGPPRGIFREPDVFCSGGEVHARGGDGIRSESDAEARAEGIVGVVPRALHDVFSEFEHAEIVEDELVWVFDVDAEAELAERVSLGADEILLDVLVLLAEMVEGSSGAPRRRQVMRWKTLMTSRSRRGHSSSLHARNTIVAATRSTSNLVKDRFA